MRALAAQPKISPKAGFALLFNADLSLKEITMQKPSARNAGPQEAATQSSRNRAATNALAPATDDT